MVLKTSLWRFIALLAGWLTIAVDKAGAADIDALPPGAVARLGVSRFQHGGTITCLAASPDGKVVAAGGTWDERHRQRGYGICLWSSATGKKTREFHAPAGAISCLGFSPDGRTLAACCGRVVCLWETATGKEVCRYSHQGKDVLFAHFSSDGKTVLSGDQTAEVHRVDGATGRKLRVWAPWQEKQPRLSNGLAAEDCSAFAVSADGKTFVWQINAFRPLADMQSMGAGCFLRIHNLSNGAVREVNGSPAAFGKLALAPNGQTVATGLGGVWLWDTARGKLLRSVGQQLANVRGLDFSPDSRFVVSRHADSILRLWDVETGRLRQTFVCPEEEGGSDTNPPPRPFGFTLDGKTIMMGTPSGLLLWDAKTGRELRLSSGHRRPIQRLAFAADGRILMTADQQTCCLWDAKTWKEMSCFERDQTGVGHEKTLAVSNDLQQFLTQSRDKTVLLHESATHKPLHRWLIGRQDLTYGTFAPDRQSAVVGNKDGTTFTGSILDLATGKVRAHLTLRSIVSSPVYSPDSASLAWADLNRRIHLVNILTGEEVRQFGKQGVSSGEVQLVFSADGGDFLAVQPIDPPSPVRIWHVRSGVELRSVQLPLREARWVPTAGLAISPDGRTLATAQLGETAIRLWEVASGQEYRRLDGHADTVFSLAFSAKGDTLVSGCRDGTGLVWDLHPRLPTNAVLSTAQLASLWADLFGDAPQAIEAIHKLSSVPKQSVPFLKARLQPVEIVTRTQVQELIRDLDSDEFSIRENASQRFAQMGELVVADLRQVLTERPSPEVRLRSKLLLQDLQANARARAAEQLRALRSLACLEYASTAEARALLASLGRGHAEAPLTREAKAALLRLSKHP